LLKIGLCPTLKQYVEGEKLDEMEDKEWIVDLSVDDVKLMFEPVIKRIISLIQKQLDKSHKNGYDICAMFLVGGFSESKYLQARIKKEFGNRVPNIPVPILPVTAIVKGGKVYNFRTKVGVYTAYTVYTKDYFHKYSRSIWIGKGYREVPCIKVDIW
jgi:hypothetical protein